MLLTCLALLLLLLLLLQPCWPLGLGIVAGQVCWPAGLLAGRRWAEASCAQGPDCCRPAADCHRAPLLLARGWALGRGSCGL